MVVAVGSPATSRAVQALAYRRDIEVCQALMVGYLCGDPGSSRATPVACRTMPSLAMPAAAGSCPEMKVARHSQSNDCGSSATSACSPSIATDCNSDASPEAPQTPPLSAADQDTFEHESAKVAAPSPGTAQPRYVHDFRLSSLDWDDLASNREQRSSLYLRGMPLRYCQPGHFASLMKTHGLADAVDRVEVAGKQGPTGLRPKEVRRTRLGCLIVHLKSPSEVRRVAKFFHGRLLDWRVPVAVSFAPTAVAEDDCLEPGPPPVGEPMRVASRSLEPAQGPRAMRNRPMRAVTE